MLKHIAISIGLCLLLASDGGAQQVSNGLKGTVISGATATIAISASGGGDATALQTPAKGHFVLTQIGSGFSGSFTQCACTSILFSAAGFGVIGRVGLAQSNGEGSVILGYSSYVPFNPGIALPPSTPIVCTAVCASGCETTFQPTDCNVTGVLEK
jgi:hypothetical protein